MIELSFSGPQEDFLASSADIVLYGGQSGSGKSYVATIDLLGLNEERGARYTLPYYRALVYRKQRGDLLNLIDESKKLYPLFDRGARFNDSDLYWKFSSGARIYFKYFEDTKQATMFLQGQQLAAITCDELATYETDDIFKYSLSRLRSPEGLKCYYRATCNPGRYRWIKEFFRIDDEGHSTDFIIETKLSSGTVYNTHVQFIRARLSDNTYIDRDDYEAKLRLLSLEDQMALADGRWDAYDGNSEGVVYRLELEYLRNNNRICAVTHNPALPVYTAWDIGYSDWTVILFMQIHGQEKRIIDMYVMQYGNFQDHFVPEIKRREQDYGYHYAGHFLPHDSGQHEKYNGKTIYEQVSAVLPRCHQIPIAAIASGIQQTKAWLRDVYIDKDCGLYEHLTAYKYKWSPILMRWGAPDHSQHSHPADALRYASYIKPVDVVPLWVQQDKALGVGMYMSNGGANRRYGY